MGGIVCPGFKEERETDTETETETETRKPNGVLPPMPMVTATNTFAGPGANEDASADADADTSAVSNQCGERGRGHGHENSESNTSPGSNPNPKPNHPWKANASENTVAEPAPPDHPLLRMARRRVQSFARGGPVFRREHNRKHNHNHNLRATNASASPGGEATTATATATATATETSTTKPNQHQYRAFCLLVHEEKGVLLLHCTRKKKGKPPHYQLPGGRIDEDDYRSEQARDNDHDNSTAPIREPDNQRPYEDRRIDETLVFAVARTGCAREVYEETGIDFRTRPEAFLPMVLYSDDGGGDSNSNSNGAIGLINEYKGRLFFVCELRDDDFPSDEEHPPPPPSPGDFENKNNGRDLSSCRQQTGIRLSLEHSGFRWFKDDVDGKSRPGEELSRLLRFHSGGKVRKAIEMAYRVVKEEVNG